MNLDCRRSLHRKFKRQEFCTDMKIGSSGPPRRQMMNFVTPSGLSLSPASHGSCQALDLPLPPPILSASLLVWCFRVHTIPLFAGLYTVTGLLAAVCDDSGRQVDAEVDRRHSGRLP